MRRVDSTSDPYRRRSRRSARRDSTRRGVRPRNAQRPAILRHPQQSSRGCRGSGGEALRLPARTRVQFFAPSRARPKRPIGSARSSLFAAFGSLDERKRDPGASPQRSHRVANAVTFPTDIRTAANSKPLANGEAVPNLGTASWPSGRMSRTAEYGEYEDWMGAY